MLFRDYWESLLGSRAKVKVAMLLAAKESAASERKLAAELGLSPMTVNRIMAEFRDLGFVERAESPNSNHWKVRKTGFAYRTVSQLKQPMDVLLAGMKSALKNKGVEKAYFFGPLAKEEEKPESEIGILVLVPTEEKAGLVRRELQELVGKVKEIYGNEVRLSVMTDAEFEEKQQLRNILNEGMRLV